MFEDIIQFISQLVDLINDFPDTTDTYWERLIIWIIITWLEMKTYMIEIAWGIAQQILTSMGLADHLQTAWGAIPHQHAQFLNYLRIPESINLVLTAYLTRFILGLLP